MKVGSIILGVVGGVLLVTSVLTILFFPLDSFMVWSKVGAGLLMVVSSVVLNWEGVRDGVTRKNTAFLLSSVVMTAGLAGILGAINYYAQANKTEFDLTKDKVFTLSDQTIKVLGELKDDVTVTAFFLKSEPEGDELQKLVSRYQAHTGKLRLSMLNPEMHPDLIEKYKVTQSSPRIILESGGHEARAKEITEEALTNALMEVGTTTRRHIYVTAGHGEMPLEGADENGLKAFVDDLKSEGYEVDALNLMDKQMIPADAAMVMVPGPKTAMFDPEVKTLTEYLDKGGKLLLLAEPGTTTGLEALLKTFRLELGKNTVLDGTQFGRMLGPDMAILAQYADHAAVKPMEGLPTMLKGARSVNVLTGDAAYSPVTLASTGPGTWGETHMEGGDWEWNDGELRGPVSVLAVSTHSTKEAPGKMSDEARLLVVGDAEVAGNRMRAMAANRDLMLNLVAYTAADENKITIRPRQRGASRIMLTPTQASMIAFFSLDAMPVTILAAGLAVWLVRRRR